MAAMNIEINAKVITDTISNAFHTYDTSVGANSRGSDLISKKSGQTLELRRRCYARKENRFNRDANGVILILRPQNAKCRLNRTFGATTLLFFRVTEIRNTWTAALLQFKNRATLVTRSLVNSLEHARRE